MEFCDTLGYTINRQETSSFLSVVFYKLQIAYKGKLINQFCSL